MSGAVASEAPATYVWEPTTDALAVRYGLPRESIVRFDVNTSPVPPDLRDVLAGPFDPSLSEYPPSDYAALVAAAATAYKVKPNEILPTAGADEALDLTARAFLREGSVAVVASPTYAMYRIVCRAARCECRLGAEKGSRGRFRAGHSGSRRGRPHGRHGLAVRTEQPHRRLRTARTHRRAPRGAGVPGPARRPRNRTGSRRGRGVRRVRRADRPAAPRQTIRRLVTSGR